MAKREIGLAIVGGGIGGLALAAGLLHRGLNVEIYEAASEFAEIGAGVAFGPNSVSAMSKIAPGVLEAYIRQATENGDPKERATWFDFHHGVGNMEQIHKVTPRNAEIGLSSVHRAHFLDGLAALVPRDIAHFGKRLTSLEELPSGRIKLFFDDKTTAEADAVIGCDGVKSKVRPIVLGPESNNIAPCYSNKYAYRGLVPMDKAAKVLGDYYARNGQMYLGLNGHVLTFPIEHGKTMNVVAFQTGTGSWEQERWVLPTPKEHRMKDFAEWNEKVQHILNVSYPPPLPPSLLLQSTTEHNNNYAHGLIKNNFYPCVDYGRVGRVGPVRSPSRRDILQRANCPLRRRSTCLDTAPGCWCWPGTRRCVHSFEPTRRRLCSHSC